MSCRYSRLLPAALLAVLIATFPLAALGQTPHDQEGWSWRKMFGLPKKAEKKEPVEESEGFQLGRPRMPEMRTPSPIKQVGYTAKKAWNKTVDVITPDRRPEPEAQRPQRTFDLSHNRNQEEEKKPGFFSRLFGKKEPERPSNSVTDFLGQPRP